MEKLMQDPVRKAAKASVAAIRPQSVTMPAVPLAAGDVPGGAHGTGMDRRVFCRDAAA